MNYIRDRKAQNILQNIIKIIYESIFLIEIHLFQYDANTPGIYGGGGEYVVQSGFGWTNGVVFELLDIYCSATSNDNVMVSNEKCTPIPA